MLSSSGVDIVVDFEREKIAVGVCRIRRERVGMLQGALEVAEYFLDFRHGGVELHFQHDAAQEKILNLADRRLGRAGHTVAEQLAQTPGICSGEQVEFEFVAVFQRDIYQAGERWIVESLALGNLMVVKAR